MTALIRQRPDLNDLRRTADGLEALSDRGQWPLPQYWEMMFIN